MFFPTKIEGRVAEVFNGDTSQVRNLLSCHENRAVSVYNIGIIVFKVYSHTENMLSSPVIFAQLTENTQLRVISNNFQVLSWLFHVSFIATNQECFA